MQLLYEKISTVLHGTSILYSIQLELDITDEVLAEDFRTHGICNFRLYIFKDSDGLSDHDSVKWTHLLFMEPTKFVTIVIYPVNFLVCGSSMWSRAPIWQETHDAVSPAYITENPRYNDLSLKSNT